ncbi:MAG: peptide/nickel transport system permease protein [Gaiellaceae bacterium]|nr:peptide/nickel transport system permease protein [Gaiellaceae bacterium]
MVVSEGQLDAPRPQSQWALAWRRFKRDRVAVGCGIFLLVVVFAVGPGAPLYEKAVGHGPNDFFPYAVSVGLRPAGPFTVTWNTPVMYGDNPFVFKHPDPPKGTGKTLLLLGADSALGRDEFLRVLYGGRVSLEIAAGAALFAILIGLVLGAVAGYYGGWIDAVISRFTDLVMAFPLLLFLVMIGSFFAHGLTDWTFHGLINQGVFQLVLIIGAFTWFYPARVVRGQIMSLRHKEFVEAAQMVGARDGRIVRTHLLPHVLPPLLAYGTLLIATNIMIEVGVTFLGAGIKLPTASWGSLLAQTWGSILNPNTYNPSTVQPWLTLVPSIAIFLTVFSLNQFGEGLREATDPRSVR